MNYYETLGVSKNATPDDIKDAYRKLVKKIHPDVVGNKNSGDEKIKAVNEAYKCLSNIDDRRAYDASLARENSMHYTKVFSFSKGFSNVKKIIKARPEFYTITITFDEVIHGCVKKINNMNVRVPPGTTDGTNIVCKNAGSLPPPPHPPNVNFLPADVIITVFVEKHDTFKIEENNIICNVKIDLETALFGGEIEIPKTEGGALKHQLLPLENLNNNKIIFKGQGLYNQNKFNILQKRGDKVVNIDVVAPRLDNKITKNELRNFLKRLK